ncbi:TDT family transporter [Thaumasiovibrio subtropicus]|uniref:TDT family transporter n=1 Tax=Thaumasiovibrio subtropicus TaxID=1891207 RepID=UPI000B363536|nr:TDT family transporter [Thaumasiovibrio subtropicus]
MNNTLLAHLLQLIRRVPTAQAALALGTMGVGLAWSLFVPQYASFLRPFFTTLGACFLFPVLLKYIITPSLIWRDLQHPLYGSLMAPITMSLLVLSDYLSGYYGTQARFLWYPAMTLHFSFMAVFFFHQFRHFKLTNIVPSWFLYPVGAISGTLAGPQLGYTEFALTMAHICIALYFIILPVMLYRLIFAPRLPKAARPTLAIMAAPINLTLAAYMQNFADPDPILTGALAGLSYTMTFFIYLCYPYLLKQPFHPSIAAITFPSVIGSVATERTMRWLATDYPHWNWLSWMGQFEVLFASAMVLWVFAGYSRYYWARIDLIFLRNR